MMNGYGNGYDCGGYGLFGGWHFIVPILIIGIIVYAIYKLATSNKSQTNHNFAIEELNRKFVNGEISESDYLQKKQIIDRK